MLLKPLNHKLIQTPFVLLAMASCGGVPGSLQISSVSPGLLAQQEGLPTYAEAYATGAGHLEAEAVSNGGPADQQMFDVKTITIHSHIYVEGSSSAFDLFFAGTFGSQETGTPTEALRERAIEARAARMTRTLGFHAWNLSSPCITINDHNIHSTSYLTHTQNAYFILITVH